MCILYEEESFLQNPHTIEQEKIGKVERQMVEV